MTKDHEPANVTDVPVTPVLDPRFLRYDGSIKWTAVALALVAETGVHMRTVNRWFRAGKIMNPAASASKRGVDVSTDYALRHASAKLGLPLRPGLEEPLTRSARHRASGGKAA